MAAHYSRNAVASMEIGRTTGSVIFPVSDLTGRNLHPVLIYAYDNEQSNKSRVAIFSQKKSWLSQVVSRRPREQYPTVLQIANQSCRQRPLSSKWISSSISLDSWPWEALANENNDPGGQGTGNMRIATSLSSRTSMSTRTFKSGRQTCENSTAMGTGEARRGTTAPSMTGTATMSSVTPATRPPRRPILVMPPQIPGVQVQDNGFHRVHVVPMTVSTSSGKEGPTLKEPIALQWTTLEDMLDPPHHPDLHSLAGTRMRRLPK